MQDSLHQICGDLDLIESYGRGLALASRRSRELSILTDGRLKTILSDKVISVMHVAGEVLWLGTDDGEVGSYTEQRGVSWYQQRHDLRVTALLPIGDDFLVSGSDDHTLKFWQQSGAVLFSTQPSETSDCYRGLVCFTGAKKQPLLAAHTVSGSLEIWQCNDSTLKLWGRSPLHTGSVTGLVVVGTSLVTASLDATSILWMTDEDKTLIARRRLRTDAQHSAIVAFPEQERVAIGSYNGKIYLWKTSRQPENVTGLVQNFAITSMCRLQPHRLAVAGHGTQIAIWDMQEEAQMRQIEIQGPVRALRFNPARGFHVLARGQLLG